MSTCIRKPISCRALATWLSASIELQPEAALIFAGPAGEAARAGGCAFHVRGDERGLMEVVCQQGRGQVHLAGDGTAFTRHEGLDDAFRQAILDRIGVRLQDLERHQRQKLPSSRLG